MEINNEEKTPFNGEDEKEKFSEFTLGAEETLKDKEKTQSIIEKALRLLKKITAKSIKALQEDILLMLDILKAYITGRYRKIPFKSLIMILAAVNYLLFPFDVLFDYLPGGIGFLDDCALLTATIMAIESDLKAYKAWKATQGETHEAQANSETVQQA